MGKLRNTKEQSEIKKSSKTFDETKDWWKKLSALSSQFPCNQ